MVLDRVLHQAAQDAGVTVTRKEVQKIRAELENQAGRRRRRWKGLAAAVRRRRRSGSTRTSASSSRPRNSPPSSAPTPARPAFWKALSEASKKLDVDLNPRYGSWDVQKSSRVEAKLPWLREVTAAGSQETA